MTKQQKAIVKKWAQALRSGNYEQGERTLHSKDARTGKEKWCCLGVLCDLAVKEGVIPAPTTFQVGEIRYNYRNKGKGFLPGCLPTSSLLPTDVLRWAGLQRRDGGFHTPPEATSLAALNDDGVTSFESIAVLIESKPEGLFY